MISMTKIQNTGGLPDDGVLQNTIPENFKDLSYDLRIKSIIIPNDSSHEDVEKYYLPPGNTVFVSTIEDIHLPDNMIGLIVQRNSIIRSGLVVDAPVYLPGHHTKMFIRVHNISQDDIVLAKEHSIASIMFDELSESINKYSGKYTDEFDYRGIGSFARDIPQPVRIDKKMQNIENIEKSIYEKVVTVLTIFVGVFSIINLNINFLNRDVTYILMIIYNLMTIGSIGMMIGFIGFIINHKRKVPWIISIFSLVLIIISVVLCLH